jgi:hypothetical protein
MSENNLSFSTQSTEWFKKADYRKVTLERFDDAVVLYTAARYEFSFYTSGYVIEIGAKAKMAELVKTMLSDTTTPILWKLIEELINKNLLINKENPFPSPEPQTIYDFCKYLYKVAEDSTKKYKGKDPKAIHNVLKDSILYQALTEGRVYNTDPNNPDNFHAPALFLETVQQWADILGKGKYYDFKGIATDFRGLDWSTSLRYGESTSNLPQEQAKKALSIACRFIIGNLLSEDKEEQAKYLILYEHLNLKDSSDEEVKILNK